jgi:hypothetical protein
MPLQAGDTHPMRSRLLKRSLLNVSIILLLCAVAGLSTLAKNSQYFPKSNPTHYVNIATKMKAAPSRVVVQRERLSPVAKVLPPKSEVLNRYAAKKEASLPLPSVGVTVSVQHRSPPSSLC